MTAPTPQAGGWVERCMKLSRLCAVKSLCKNLRSFSAAERALNAELTKQAALTERLAKALELALEDSQAAIVNHLEGYGENYRPGRLKYMRDALAEAQSAIAAYRAHQKGPA